MPEHELWFTALLNRLLAGPATALMNLFGVHPANPSHPIPDYIAMQIIVLLVIMVLLGWLKGRISADRPGRIQHLMELLVDALGSQTEEIVGHEGHHFVPIIFTLGIFILFANLLGTFPTLESPTNDIAVTLGCALVSFVYYNYRGLRHHGFAGYARTFMGPMLVLAPLMFLIEIVSHLARVLSLSVRLFANMLAGSNITKIFASLIPFGVPVVFEGLHIFVGLLQAYIFVLLTMVYLAGAVAEEH